MIQISAEAALIIIASTDADGSRMVGIVVESYQVFNEFHIVGRMRKMGVRGRDSQVEPCEWCT